MPSERQEHVWTLKLEQVDGDGTLDAAIDGDGCMVYECMVCGECTPWQVQPLSAAASHCHGDRAKSDRYQAYLATVAPQPRD